jgi:hypothetical protein
VKLLIKGVVKNNGMPVHQVLTVDRSQYVHRPPGYQYISVLKTSLIPIAIKLLRSMIGARVYERFNSTD